MKMKTSELCKSCLIFVTIQAQYCWWVVTIFTKTAQLINKTSVTGPLRISVTLMRNTLYSPWVTVWPAKRVLELSDSFSTLFSNDVNGLERPELERWQLNMETIYFPQDTATAHTALASMVSRNISPGQLISRFGDIP